MQKYEAMAHAIDVSVFHPQKRPVERPFLCTVRTKLAVQADVFAGRPLASAALVDRILHHGEVFYLKGPSWRVKGRSVEGDLVPAVVAATNVPLPTREEDANTLNDNAGLIHSRATGDSLGK